MSVLGGRNPPGSLCGWLPKLPSLFEADFYFRLLPCGSPTVTRASLLGPLRAAVVCFQWVLSEAPSSPVSVKEKEENIGVQGGRD